MKRSLFAFTLAVGLAVPSALAANELTPEFVIPKPGQSTYICGMSDNGKWGLIEKASATEGSIEPARSSIINMETLEILDISAPEYSPGLTLNGVADVSNDGSIVVGSYNQRPAYWQKGKGWTILTAKNGVKEPGRLRVVTPDGRYAAGNLSKDGDMHATPIMFDLTTGEEIALPGLPTKDISGEEQGQAWVSCMSPDGRYLVMQMSYSYVMPPSTCVYLYDRQSSTVTMLGYSQNADGTWKRAVPGLTLVSEPHMSPNGKWLTGYAYYVGNGTEYQIPFRYEIEKGEITLVNDEGDNDSGGVSIDNNGYMYATTPAANPYSYAAVKKGKYYVTFDQIYQQVYGIDFKATLGFSNSGKPIHVSEDGMTIVMMPTNEDNYILRLKEPISASADRVDLLANPTITPADGSVMSQSGTFIFTFTREIEANGPYNRITLKSEDGKESWNPLSSNGFNVSGNKATLTFRGRALREGVKYTLTIPAGMIRIKGDNTVTNKEFTTTIIGRKQSPVQVVSAVPADDASVEFIDLQQNPVLITLDADVKRSESAKGFLYRNDETEPFCELNILSADKRILVYPTNLQYLFEGTNYRLVIPAGTVYDLSGSEVSANEEIVINYRGAHQLVVNPNDKYLISTDCSNYGTGFMFYDGDRRNPSSIPAGWGFNAQIPWYIVRDQESKDMAWASHSMYTPAGKADDWFSTAQLYIPDKDCYINFLAQSYKKDKNDHLKVYVYPCDKVYNTFTKDFADELREKADLVFDEQLFPGESEENLEGDWKEYRIPLEKYAGKSVYVAFCNDNDDQSAVFVDNVQVVHDMRFKISLENDQRVVNREELPIFGSIVVASEVENYKSVKIILRDENGNELDRIEESGLDLKKDDVYHFRFEKPFKLTMGAISKFSLEVSLDERTSILNSDIRNLAFEPVKRVVLEEYSGMLCSNCPLGFSAVENLMKLYPNNFIPVVIRTFTPSDPLASGENLAEYTSFLGMNAAPSGKIDRMEPASSPMVSNGGDYGFSGEGLFDSSTGDPIKCWLDLVRERLAQPAEADLQMSNVYDSENDKINVTVDVRNALNVKDLNLNLFTVVLENGIATTQQNGFSSVTDPDLGEWGAGGKYAQSFAQIVMDHVARGAYGNTFLGTAGLIPSTLSSDRFYTANYTVNMPAQVNNPENVDVVVMLINANTGEVLNSIIAPINGKSVEMSGVEGVFTEAAGDALIYTANGNVHVAAEGKLSAKVFDLSGRTIAAAQGSDELNINMNGFRGIALVMAVTADGKVTVKKVMMR